MRGLDSRRPLLAMRSPTVLLVALFFLSSFGIASTRSVENSRHHNQEGHLDHDVRSQDLGSEKEHEDISSPQIVEDEGVKDTIIGKSAIDSKASVLKTSELNVDQEGIRRFDAVVATEEISDSGSKEKIPNSNEAQHSEIDKTVTKGIIVRDEPVGPEQIEEETIQAEISEKVEEHRKRSIKDSRSIAVDSQAQQNEEAAKENIDTSANHSEEKIQEKILEHAEDHIIEDSQAKDSEAKTIAIVDDGPGIVEAQVHEELGDPRNVEPIVEDIGEKETHSDSNQAESASVLVSRDSLSSSSLPELLKTNSSLEVLISQAVALQSAIKDEAFLQQLRKELEILPGIPKFTEQELFDTLNMISLVKKGEDQSDYSYVSKMDTSSLTENQLNIIKCAETLVAREQRQSFTENLFECIRGLNILNCMRIFIWPVIADNIPESFSQNLPSLPIEVNVADWLPGNQRDKSFDTELRSSSTEEEKLLTPELVVTKILKDALSTSPNSGKDLPTFIDPKNETLSKFLTPGQLEILRMAEMFLPVSFRQEYSDKMYSCVQRFEYFSCVKYFTWPMIKQHYEGLPEFPDYQNWYPNVSFYPGYPILPYPIAEGGLPEVVEADATRRESSKPELTIVQLLKDTRRQTGIPILPTYYSTFQPGTRFSPITADQMAIFYTAEQLVPVPMRSEFMSKTMKCIRDYDYLTCTKYSTWPAIRQLYPTLPQFPDFSSWIPTFSVPEIPDFSQYIPNWSGYFPTFPQKPSFPQKPQPGGSEQQPSGGSSDQQTGGGSSGQQSGGASSEQQQSSGGSWQQGSGGSSGQQQGSGGSWQQGSGSSSGQQSGGSSSGQQGSGGSWQQGSGSSSGQQSGGSSSGQQGSGGSWQQGSGSSSGQQSGGSSSGQQGSGGSWQQGSGGSSGQQQGSGSSSGQQQGSGGSWQQGSESSSEQQQGSGGSWQQGSGGSSGQQQGSGGSSGQSGGGSSGQSGGGSSGQQQAIGGTWEQQSGGSSSVQQPIGGTWEQSSGSSSGQQGSGGSWQQGSGGSSGQQSGGSSSGQQGSGGSWQQGSGSSSGQQGSGSSSGEQSGGSSSGQQGSGGSWQQGSGSSSEQSSSGSSSQQSGGGSAGQGEQQQVVQPQPVPSKPSYHPHPHPIPIKPPYHPSGSGSTVLSEDQRLYGSTIEKQIIDILSNIRFTLIPKNFQQNVPVTQGSLAILESLTANQLQIFGLSKSVIPVEARADLDARFIGCLQGGSDFLSCTRNVIWPTLQLYVRDLPNFPHEEKAKISVGSMMGDPSISGFANSYVITPGIYQPIIHPTSDISGRSPLESQIAAEAEEELPSSQTQTDIEIPLNTPVSQQPGGQLRQEVSAKSGDPITPVISVTDTRFTPIFSDHPETVLLKILTSVRPSSKLPDSSQILSTGENIESLRSYLTSNELSVVQVSENLLPANMRAQYMDKMSRCLKDSNFMMCTRDVLWPTLSLYYPRLPSFPHFNIEADSLKKINSPAAEILRNPNVESLSSAISETDVKTGQHGDATVTITDTRFVPIFSEHPEELILGILKNFQSSLPNLPTQSEIQGAADKSTPFVATFTDQQGNIVTLAESFLPESIREIFRKRMTECMRDNLFLDCTRDIAWPTIAQFFPRLPNFPNIGVLPAPAIDIQKPAQQPTLLPPQLEPIQTLRHTVPQPLAQPNYVPSSVTLIPSSPEDEVESRIELTLKRISSVTKNSEQPEQSYGSKQDPLLNSLVSERQASVIRMCENLLPNSIKPVFVGKMVECSRADAFPNCIRNIGWPTLRQYVPNIPDFPDFSNLGSYLPQEFPQAPQLPEYPQSIQVPGLGSFGIPGQNYFYPFRISGDAVAHQQSPYIPQSVINSGGQLGGFYGSGNQGLTSSVADSASARARAVTDLSMVSTGNPTSQPSDLSSESEADKLSEQLSEGRRKRRSLEPESSQMLLDDSQKFNMTESELLQILINMKNQRDKKENDKETSYFVDSLNETMKQSLSPQQQEILILVQDINSETVKAGFMSRVIQCIRSLSFLRCMGIFVWPLISQNLPTLPSLPTLGGLNPFGRSQDANNFEEVFGVKNDEFERVLLERKENVEKILVDWYRGLVEEKFERDYGFMRFKGYGDGEIGISFNGFGRKGKAAKLKDNKNLPSILTIISDIMEDMLDQRDSKYDHSKKRDHAKKFRHDKSLHDRTFIDENNDLVTENSRQESINDHNIISTILDKIRSNGSDETSDTNNYLSVDDAYEAFEMLFGTRLNERTIERLNSFDKTSDSRHRKDEKEKKDRSGLILRLPKINEELLSRRITGSLVELGRKMEMQVSPVVPAVSFAVSLFIQTFLAHARAAASIAGMMSNMALGSAMLTMLRQTFFGPMTNPKIKYVYDHAPAGPGITWPQHIHH